MGIKHACFTIALATSSLATPAFAEWTHRYPKVEGYGHQIYLEQENLPILSSGPIYAAPSPDGSSIAVAHQGWIWLVDLETSTATRLTESPGVDSRPRWSPDGRKIAFVRDSGKDTAIVIRSLDGASEQVIDSPAIDLDPEFTRGGGSLVYSSAKAGPIQLWQRDLATGEESALGEEGRLRRGARAMADGSIIYLEPAYPGYRIGYRSGDGSEDKMIFEQGWMAHLDPDTHPAERAIVYGMASDDDVRLAVMDIDQPTLPRVLTPQGQKALFPAWSADGGTIYYSIADENEQFHLMRVSATGGAPEEVIISNWDYGVVTGSARLKMPAPARVSIASAEGHPIPNTEGAVFSDSQNGPAYFYSDGNTSLTLPEGKYRVVATRGPFSLPIERDFAVQTGKEVEIALDIETIWSAREAGYAAGDYHIHLNSSGVHRLAAEDILLPMQGEALDYASPMAWNLFNRFVDAEKIGQTVSVPNGPVARYAQEVRSDFHGHIGLVAPPGEYNPYIYGPGIPVYGNRDLHNGAVTAFAKRSGALSTYVHPVPANSDPFADFASNRPPLELVLDGVLSSDIALEVLCQWTGPLGASELWYRFLNIGKPMPATGGTDMFVSFYRAPAIGTARSYVPIVAAAEPFDAAIDQIKSGRGFISTGPALLFAVDGVKPGDAVAAGQHEWSLDLVSVRPVDRVEIVVNGKVVKTFKGFRGRGSKIYKGTVDLPAGGWIAARAVGGDGGWPSMTAFHFAHTQPVWIGQVGSIEPSSATASAQDLLKLVDFAEDRFRSAYGDNIPPGLVKRIDAARQRLQKTAGS